MHASRAIYQMALHIAQDHSGPSWWQLWVCLWVLCFLWWCWSSIYFDFYATHVMSTFSALSRFFYTSLWLELYWWQVSVSVLAAFSKQFSLHCVVIINYIFLKLWTLSLKQAWECIWMSCKSLAIRWGRGWLLDVWTSRPYRTICFQCCYRFNHAR